LPVISGFFSIAETAMMALNRYRLKHLVETGHKGAKLTQSLLARTDRLLGVILLGNNLVNAAAATLTAIVTVQLFGDNKIALAVGTGMITLYSRIQRDPSEGDRRNLLRRIAFPQLRSCYTAAQSGLPVRLVHEPVRQRAEGIAPVGRLQSRNPAQHGGVAHLVLEASHFILRNTRASCQLVRARVDRWTTS
jgi:hypothetical protein